MKKKIVLLTGYNHFFGQTRKPWVSIDTSLLIAELKTKGFDVSEYDFHQVCNSRICIQDSIVFYTFSQREQLREYMKDIIFGLQSNGNLVIPDYKLLLCHENKGFQECLKKELGISSIPAFYFSSKREISSYDIEFPIVLKTIDGSNARGVFLVKSHAELLQTIAGFEPKTPFLTKLDLFRRKYFRKNKHFPGYEVFDSEKDYNEYKDYIIPEKRFILQKFIPGLEFDFRVIILGEHYFVAKRFNRKGDFRASGAKRFNFDFKADDELLDYAKNVYDKFDTPCLSIDIGISAGQYYLFEYQAIHFGINTIVRGNGFYHNTNRGWYFLNEKVCFEKELANALVFHLVKKNVI